MAAFLGLGVVSETGEAGSFRFTPGVRAVDKGGLRREDEPSEEDVVDMRRKE